MSDDVDSTDVTPISPSVVLGDAANWEKSVQSIVQICNVQLKQMAQLGRTTLSLLLPRGTTEDVTLEAAARFRGEGWTVLTRLDTDPAPTLVFSAEAYVPEPVEPTEEEITQAAQELEAMKTTPAKRTKK